MVKRTDGSAVGDGGVYDGHTFINLVAAPGYDRDENQGAPVEATVYPCSRVFDKALLNKSQTGTTTYHWCIKSFANADKLAAFEKEHPWRLVAGKIQDSVRIGDGSIAYLICGASINPMRKMTPRELQSWALNGRCLLVAHPVRNMQVVNHRASGTLPGGQYQGSAFYLADLPDGMKVQGQPVSVPMYETNPPTAKQLNEDSFLR